MPERTKGGLGLVTSGRVLKQALSIEPDHLPGPPWRRRPAVAPTSQSGEVGPGEAAGGTAATARGNGRKRVLDEPPLALAKNNDRDSSIGQTLLVPDVPAGRQEHIECRAGCGPVPARRSFWLPGVGFLGGQISAPVIDGLLATTALDQNLTLVTRNTKDIAVTGVPVFNPWSG